MITLDRTGPVRIARRRTPGGGSRDFTFLSPRDALAWQALAGEIAPLLERALDRRVAANRVVLASHGWRLEDVGEAGARVRTLAPALGGTVLQTDVASFYRSVRPEILERCLIGIGAPAAVAARAASLVAGWERWGARGLPVGPPASAVMANAVLVPIDRSLGTRPFVRWVDDYRIGVAGSRDAAAILAKLDAALASVHLRRSITKTQVGPASSIRFPGSDYTCR